MEAQHKKVLKAVSLELRHLLEGTYDGAGQWHPGDLEQRLAAIGVRRDRESVNVDELPHLSLADQKARQVVDAYLQLRAEAGVAQEEAVAEFVRETAYSWANRLLALRCIEARELIDEVIVQKAAYGGRSLEHHRLAQRQPELCVDEDDGLLAVLEKVFAEQARHMPMLFDHGAPGVALKPSAAAIKRCMALLSDSQKVGDQDVATTDVFMAHDAFGWAYQYWNTDEKDRVFTKVRTQKGAKIEGADIIPATQLYTEPYMVKFLVQNSLGATWMGMHPDSKLCESWEYYVRDADRSPVEKKSVAEITFLDPACGSGHFLLEAFDLFYGMYVEEGRITDPEAICRSILENNLYGIDVDARAVQIAEVALWMKAAERAFDYKGVPTNLVAATASHLKGEAWEEFLAGFEREPLVARVLRKFAQTMEHIDEIGSLARPVDDLREIIRQEHATWERQVRERKAANYLFPEIREEAVRSHLPFQEISDQQFGHRLFNRAQFALDDFTQSARERGEFDDQMLASETRAGFRLVDLLGRHYDVVAANPPYMGSKNMGAELKQYVHRHFKPGKRDLYAAFILRALNLTTQCGACAILTQQSWLSNRYFRDLRCAESPGAGVLRNNMLQVMAHLGPNAFTEISGEVVAVTMTVFQTKVPIAEHRCTFIRLVDLPDPSTKDAFLRQSVSSSSARRYSVVQRRLLDIPDAPVVYWLSENLFRPLSEANRLPEIAVPYEGCHPTDTPRFVRFFWEVDCRRRWTWYSRGGEFCRWHGMKRSKIESENDFCRHRATGKAIIPSRDKYFIPAITYTDFASGNMAARVLEPDEIFSDAAPAVIPKLGIKSPILALLNSRVITTFMRVLSPSPQHFRTGYLARAPIPDSLSPLLDDLERACIALKLELVAIDPSERSFRVELHERWCQTHPSEFSRALFVAAMLHAYEGVCERLVYTAYCLNENDIQMIEDIAGVPSSRFPLLQTKGRISSVEWAVGRMSAFEFSHEMQLPVVFNGLGEHESRTVDAAEFQRIRQGIRALFEGGPGTQVTADDDVPNDDEEGDGVEEAVGTRISIPVQSFVEELACKAEIHPISVCWVLHEGIETEAWRCLPEERRLWADRSTVAVLRLLGHRWPKQIDAGDPVPDWSDPDGIIPLTPLAHESTLFDRIQQRLRADEIDAGDFADVMGKPLDTWLATEFFKHHTKQFKKRPIAWQLQSAKFAVRKKPAFACLVYYHKLDGDLLPKIRTQYVGPLRQRLETELRGIEVTSQAARSERQEKRRVELEDQIDELRQFDAALAKVVTEGFASKELTEIAKDELLDKWCSLDGRRAPPASREAFLQQESAYVPDINDGVRVNIAPLQKAGLLAADVLAKKDLDKAIADRAEWRADERRWCREGKLPQPGWWPDKEES